ncbi:MAG: VIT1/CCC1 transporter family protein [Coriobacteriales bacterium]|jgi:VIT1/CCC1 family predicted Fe2+/Mn2+ transporter|nr:VIT1/CCC1 transporter family protein [Coriobacteriales bacterium]
MTKDLDPNTMHALLAFQKAEATDQIVYARMARFEKHDTHSAILTQIAHDEVEHYNTWKTYTGRDVSPDRLRAVWYSVLLMLFGYTFVLRLMERGEQGTAKAYAKLPTALPEVNEIIANELEHEDMLIGILDEERLQYVGAVVLGLNDALVELTGAVAGLTFALNSTRTVALAGIITGIAATLSMAASNYLAERANNNPHALKASVYTGVAYLITVVLLVTPYLLFPDDQYIGALVTMLATVVIIIMLFNFYVSVAQKKPFWSRFGKMCAISLGVALISFLIGLVAKVLLGVDV